MIEWKRPWLYMKSPKIIYGIVIIQIQIIYIKSLKFNCLSNSLLFLSFEKISKTA
jgi:hypothetical protein